jgi:hypothetical protein
MKTLRGFILIGAVWVGAFSSQAQFSISPLSTFGGGDGWLAPGEGGYTYLGTGSLERGLAYYGGHLYLVSRNGGNNIRVLNAYTGADLGTPLNTTGISGGTFAVNMAGVGADGAIYVCNLASPVDNSVPRPFKVYRWANESATPTVAFSSSTITAGRMGDNLDVIGSGTSTLIVAGESSSSGTGNRNGYAVLSTADGANFSGTLVTFPLAPPSPPGTLAGDFRLGITFTDSSHVIGTQTGVVGPPAYTAPRYTSFSGSSGTLLNTPVLSGSNLQVIMDYTTLGGIPLLATQSSGDSTVRIWDFTDPSSPVLLGSANNTSGTLAANGNAAGQMAWGDVEYDSANSVWKAKLWTMSSNQGIQAFIVTVPEPSTVGLLALGGCLVAAWNIRRRAS